VWQLVRSVALGLPSFVLVLMQVLLQVLVLVTVRAGAVAGA
jgi:hypothetical protein